MSVSATYTVQLARPEVPLAVVVLYRDGASQVVGTGGVSTGRVADAMVAAAFDMTEQLTSHDLGADAAPDGGNGESG